MRRREHDRFWTTGDTIMNAPRDRAFAQPEDVWPVQLATDGADPAEFAAAVVNEVRARLVRHPRRTAASQSGSPAALVERLTGLDPLYVVPALAHIVRSGSGTADAELAAMASVALDQLRTPASRARRDLCGLPTEHPLDYDWRFDRPTRGAIIDAVRHVKPDRVLLLGCPTLAVDRRMPPVLTTLIDDNPALAVSDPSNLVRHHRVDILNQPLATAGFEADCVVADPPFYSGIDQIRATWAARIGCDDDDFWAARVDARWVSLLLLDSVFSIPPQPLYKRDRQAWVSYPCSQHVPAGGIRVDEKGLTH